ncbi:MAG: acetyl-CoA carboxylase biotin carboxylase subunit [Myxococcales bacterium]|nr:acetyl-CoA carboxylase biotin carboxylase subunit [Myxococcales bacterium]
MAAPTERPIRRVLIANRGEIAIRVIRTLRELGIESVAVYSDVDRKAAHVLLADMALPIGPAIAAESYLVIDKIIAACKESGADAVHPGYGFLSENDVFAERLEAEGITLIGPPAPAMRLMGSKTEARKVIIEAGLPVVPGESGPGGNGFDDVGSALEAANRTGFPVLIKAAAGGGGKGMRLVEDEVDFEAGFGGAKREALSSFGDDTVFVEKAIIGPRHVEIQVFADQHGNVVHLGERDCSVQRRHQKVVEESPSPAVSEELRQRMGDSAIEAARCCNYVGAGTVEFLLTTSGEYYFLEMNTRLQVEHPVTEMVYGLDLVAWQVAVAEGKKLPLSQEEINARRRGAALECRIYAEDPDKFMPSPGTITTLRTPAGPYVRDDSCAYEGVEISMYYDPLISKLITWGDTRAQAMSRMKRALAEYRVVGIDTNIAFHQRILSHPGFVAGEYDTGIIGRDQGLTEPANAEGPELDAGIAMAALRDHVNGPRSLETHAGPAERSTSAWRAPLPTWRGR